MKAVGKWFNFMTLCNGLKCPIFQMYLHTNTVALVFIQSTKNTLELKIVMFSLGLWPQSQLAICSSRGRSKYAVWDFSYCSWPPSWMGKRLLNGKLFADTSGQLTAIKLFYKVESHVHCSLALSCLVLFAGYIFKNGTRHFGKQCWTPKKCCLCLIQSLANEKLSNTDIPICWTG